MNWRCPSDDRKKESDKESKQCAEHIEASISKVVINEGVGFAREAGMAVKKKERMVHLRWGQVGFYTPTTVGPDPANNKKLV